MTASLVALELSDLDEEAARVGFCKDSSLRGAAQGASQLACPVALDATTCSSEVRPAVVPSWPQALAAVVTKVRMTSALDGHCAAGRSGRLRRAMACTALAVKVASAWRLRALWASALAAAVGGGPTFSRTSISSSELDSSSSWAGAAPCIAVEPLPEACSSLALR